MLLTVRTEVSVILSCTFYSCLLQLLEIYFKKI